MSAGQSPVGADRLAGDRAPTTGSAHGGTAGGALAPFRRAVEVGDSLLAAPRQICPFKMILL
jgi:hypothetical protein